MNKTKRVTKVKIYLFFFVEIKEFDETITYFYFNVKLVDKSHEKIHLGRRTMKKIGCFGFLADVSISYTKKLATIVYPLPVLYRA